MGKMGKLVIAVLIVLIIFFIIMTLGAIVIMTDSPNVGDEYFTVYVIAGLIISVLTLILQLCKPKAMRPPTVPIQIVTGILILLVAALGLFLAACFALAKQDYDDSYYIVAVVLALIILGLTIAIWFINKKPRQIKHEEISSFYE